MTTLPRFILGVDPGKKSGVALLDLLLETCEGEEVAFDAYGSYLESLVDKYRPAVVSEAFVMNANTIKNTQAPWSLEAIGVARYMAGKYGCPFEVQPQSSAKRFATDERLKRLGWRRPGKGHLADGQRQALLFAVRYGWWHELLGEEERDTIDETD